MADYKIESGRWTEENIARLDRARNLIKEIEAKNVREILAN